MDELFRDYWWLIFPMFGMAMAFWGTISNERRSRSALDVIKSYVDQGKEPPPELLRLASQDEDAPDDRPGNQNSRAWTFVTFAAIAAGFGVGYFHSRGEDYAFAFLIVTVVMGVLAAGALAILILNRK